MNLGPWAPAARAAAILAAVAAVAFLDLAVKPDRAVFILYLVPVAAAARFFGRGWGFAAAGACAALLWANESWAWAGTRHPAVVAANSLMALGALGVLVAVVSRLRDRLEDERRLGELKSRMLSLVSHEFNNGLTSIRLAVALLREEAPAGSPARFAKLLDVIEGNQASLSRAAASFLNEARLDAGGMRIEVRSVPVRRLIESALELMGPMIEDKGLRVLRELPRGAPSVRADPEALEVVLTNLVSNAVKYSPPGGTVRVGLERATGGVRVYVEDHGPGLGPEDRRFILRAPFWRATEARARAKGFGFGLHLTREILERHGSRLEIDSSPGLGSTFWFDLPLGRGVAWTDGEPKEAGHVQGSV